MATQQIQTRSLFTLRNFVYAAGVAVLAPYVISRVLPLISRGLGNITGNDMLTAGKDGVRDAADDMNIGGVSGKLKRTGGRIADHMGAGM